MSKKHISRSTLNPVSQFGSDLQGTETIQVASHLVRGIWRIYSKGSADSYAIDFAEQTGFRILGTKLTQTRMEKTRGQGDGDNYLSVLTQIADKV